MSLRKISMLKILVFIAFAPSVAFLPSLSNAVAQEVNTPPDLLNPGLQSVTTLLPLSITLTTNDPDVVAGIQTLTYSAANLPSWASINPSTGTITGTPTEADGGTTSLVTVTVEDNGTPPLPDSEKFFLTVTEVSSASDAIHEVTTAEDIQVINSVLSNDISPDGRPAGSASKPALDTAIDNRNGAVRYTPTLNFSQPSATLVYTVANIERLSLEMNWNRGYGD